MTQILEGEREILKEQRQIKENLDLARVELEIAKREGNLDKAGEISYGIIPNLEKKFSKYSFPKNLDIEYTKADLIKYFNLKR